MGPSPCCDGFAPFPPLASLRKSLYVWVDGLTLWLLVATTISLHALQVHSRWVAPWFGGSHALKSIQTAKLLHYANSLSHSTHEKWLGSVKENFHFLTFKSGGWMTLTVLSFISGTFINTFITCNSKWILLVTWVCFIYYVSLCLAKCSCAQGALCSDDFWSHNYGLRYNFCIAGFWFLCIQPWTLTLFFYSSLTMCLILTL